MQFNVLIISIYYYISIYYFNISSEKFRHSQVAIELLPRGTYRKIVKKSFKKSKKHECLMKLEIHPTENRQILASVDEAVSSKPREARQEPRGDRRLIDSSRGLASRGASINNVRQAKMNMSARVSRDAEASYEDNRARTRVRGLRCAIEWPSRRFTARGAWEEGETNACVEYAWASIQLLNRRARWNAGRNNRRVHHNSDPRGVADSLSTDAHVFLGTLSAMVDTRTPCKPGRRRPNRNN